MTPEPWYVRRDAVLASKCRHRGLLLALTVEHERVKVGVIGSGGSYATRRVVHPIQRIISACNNPIIKDKFLGDADPDIRSQVQVFEITVELCRECPFWEEAEELALTEDMSDKRVQTN